MKEYYIDSHSLLCCSVTHPNEWFSQNCPINPERFLFFAGNQFFLIVYHRCMEHGSSYAYKKDFVKQAFDSCKELPLHKVEYSMWVDRDLKEWRLKNHPLKKYIRQANYIYSDNAGKEYAITTTIPFLDKICDQEKIDENYAIAKKHLDERGYNDLINELDQLYEYNRISIFSKLEIHKSIEHALNEINKTINNNGNDQKSKLKGVVKTRV